MRIVPASLLLLTALATATPALAATANTIKYIRAKSVYSSGGVVFAQVAAAVQNSAIDPVTELTMEGDAVGGVAACLQTSPWRELSSASGFAVASGAIRLTIAGAKGEPLAGFDGSLGADGKVSLWPDKSNALDLTVTAQTLILGTGVPGSGLKSSGLAVTVRGAATTQIASGKVEIRTLASDPKGSGDVLVASALDPGWTPLLHVASAVVVELGGALSHGAIVARELGVPMVGDVALATSALHDGDEVVVDGRRGEVWRVSPLRAPSGGSP